MARKRFIETDNQPVTTIEIEHRPIPIFLNATGRFYAKGPEGTQLESKTLDGLRAALKKAIQDKQPLNYQITIMSNDREFDYYDYDPENEESGPPEKAEPQRLEFTRATVIGGARGGYARVQYDDERFDQIFVYRRADYLRGDITQEDQERLQVLWRVAFLAKRDYDLFRRSLVIDDLEEEIKKAVAAQIAARNGDDE